MMQLSYITACIFGALGGAGLLFFVAKIFNYFNNRKPSGKDYYLLTIQQSEMKYTAQTLASSETQARQNIISSEGCAPEEISTVIRLENLEEPNELEELLNA